MLKFRRKWTGMYLSKNNYQNLYGNSLFSRNREFTLEALRVKCYKKALYFSTRCTLYPIMHFKISYKYLKINLIICTLYNTTSEYYTTTTC